MKSTPTDIMTEKELVEESDSLTKFVMAGDATPKDAQRLTALRLALKEIQTSKKIWK